MLPWINEQLNETKEQIHKWRLSRNVNVLATVDHIELASSHIILGLNVAWENKTNDPIAIIEIQVMVYKRRDEELLLRLLPLERFGRPDIKRTLEKSPLSQITLPPREIHTEHIRFLSYGNFDLPPGTYTTDILIRDTNHNTYTRRTKIDVENKMKYRLTEDWTATTPGK
jgi:hypothetical protein